jgi:hypothetical protein
VTEQDSSRVECYSGHTYPQDPRVVIWKGRRLPVISIEQRWRTPQGPGFSVETEGGVRFTLQYDELKERWAIQPDPGFGSEALESSEQAGDSRERNSHNYH